MGSREAAEGVLEKRPSWPPGTEGRPPLAVSRA
jgi:hypothetical protein